MKNDQPETAEPAAYDAQGRPLYYQEPTRQPVAAAQPTSLVSSKPKSYEGHDFDPKIRAQYANEPDFVHTTRAVEPTVPGISEELQRKHDVSVRRFPSLNLSEGEFVILQIRRHPIGLLIPTFLTALSVVVLMTFAFLVPDFYSTMESTSASALAASEGPVVSILLLLALLSVAFGGASIWVYQKNQFFLTNESVIQEIQISLFSRREQTVSLGSIEDASFRRQGVLQHLFNYGTMRLSTEGEETTYRFAFVEDPKKQVAIVSNAVEAFKNGRPVDD